jgi:hypothetical protein
MKYEEFLGLVVRTMPKEHRLGQHYFNVLAELKPDIAQKLRDTPLDPFYKYSVSPDVEAAVRGSWGEES